jgi:hypothetical protein
VTERPKRPKESGPLSGLLAAMQMGGKQAGSAPRRRYYDPGKHPAPRRLVGGGHGDPRTKDTERQAKKALMAERGITTGRQWKKLLKQLRREERLERDARRRYAIVRETGAVVETDV